MIMNYLLYVDQIIILFCYIWYYLNYSNKLIFINRYTLFINNVKFKLGIQAHINNIIIFNHPL